MDNYKKNSEVLFKASGKGLSVIIHGRKKEDGSWECAVEKNDVQITQTPKGDLATSLGLDRDYEKTEFIYRFDEAFKRLEYYEWYLCHPGKVHADFTEFVTVEYDKRIKEYDNDFPSESPMESFIRDNKTKEWRNITRPTS